MATTIIDVPISLIKCMKIKRTVHYSGASTSSATVTSYGSWEKVNYNQSDLRLRRTYSGYTEVAPKAWYRTETREFLVIMCDFSSITAGSISLTLTQTEANAGGFLVGSKSTSNDSEIIYDSGTAQSYTFSGALEQSFDITNVGQAEYGYIVMPSSGVTNNFADTSCISLTAQITYTGAAHVNAGGTWGDYTPYVNVNGVWKEATVWINVNGVWKEGI